MNWERISQEFQFAFEKLAFWIEGLYHPHQCTQIRFEDEEGNPSKHHLKILAKETGVKPAGKERRGRKPVNGKRKNQEDEKAQLKPAMAFFQERDLFDFFDEQKVDISIRPHYSENAIGVAQRTFVATIYCDGMRIYPSNSDSLGSQFAGRKEAETFAFESAFHFLHSQYSIGREST